MGVMERGAEEALPRGRFDSFLRKWQGEISYWPLMPDFMWVFVPVTFQTQLAGHF